MGTKRFLQMAMLIALYNVIVHCALRVMPSDFADVARAIYAYPINEGGHYVGWVVDAAVPSIGAAVLLSNNCKIMLSRLAVSSFIISAYIVAWVPINVAMYGRHVGWFDGPLHEKAATLVIIEFFSFLIVFFFTKEIARQKKAEAAKGRVE
jgi:hypothetical protein